jgi:hypothetical protein
MNGEAHEPPGTGSGDPIPPPAPSPIPESPPIPVAPPTVAGPLGRPPRQIVWPITIGVIGIAFGSLGILRSLYGAATPWLFNSWTFYTPSSTNTFDPFAALRHWGVWLSLVNAIGVLVAVMLLIGGIGLLRRRPWSGTLLIAWAIIRIPLAFAETVVGIGMQQEQLAAMSSQPGGAMVSAFASGFAWFGAVVSIAMYCALPTFMLIWFTRPAHRRTLEAWRIVPPPKTVRW